MAQTIDAIAALPPEIIEHICIRFSAILRAVWVVDAAALGIGLLYFLFLIFQPKEPRPRLVKWGLTHRLYGVVYCDETRCMEEWWTTSISEYSAARGTTVGGVASAAFARRRRRPVYVQVYIWAIAAIHACASVRVHICDAIW